MKQGLYKQAMPLEVEVNNSSVEEIEFKFEQGHISKKFMYPSDEVVYDASRDLYVIYWDKADTYLFEPNIYIELDARITLNGTDIQPEAINIRFKMASTLFEESE